ncbi:hypothetical protein [Aulosira sp. FACHB-615]|uniref:hypothetical protein n=1 Tax=Aulosira sp. FACHB-615 TaxID=2692777 RepID=UPI001686A78F|nr:hypothetical protein [Aulosira sp. FACHB-615]MBD2489009.1 hypothetical protein [Aulosira sp. FACHB-615]
MRQLTLSIDSLTCTLKRFTQYDRTTADTGQTEYSIVGTPLDSGPVYEPKLIWSVGAMVSYEQWFSLNAIFHKSDKIRRDQGNYRILVEDSIENFTESGTRTRGLATGGSETTFPGGVNYPASFYCRMFEPKSQWQRNQQYPYIASFTLRELDKTEEGSEPGGGGEIITTGYIAATSLLAYRMVTLNTSGEVIYADNINPDHIASVWAINKTSVATGQTVTGQTFGEVENLAWSWTPQDPIFLGANGTLTQIPPTTGFVLIVGWAMTATKMFITIKQAIAL